jgi:hypothetical protein
LTRAARKGDVRAANAIVDRAIKGLELADVLARLQALEQRAAHIEAERNGSSRR